MWLLCIFLQLATDIAGGGKAFVANQMPEVLNISVFASVALSIRDLMRPNFIELLNSKLPEAIVAPQPFVEFKASIPVFDAEGGMVSSFVLFANF